MFLRRVIIIIIAIIVLAGGFQLLRSFGVINLIKNVNSPIELSEPKSPDIPEGVNFEKYLIVSDKSEKNSLKTEEQLKIVLDYMKKEYLVVDVDDDFVNFSDYDCVFFTFERLDFLKDIEKYREYVYSGGTIILLTRPLIDKTFESIANILGIKKYQEEVYDTNGIEVLSNIIIGAKDFKTASDIIKNSSLKVEVDDNCIVHLISYDRNPMLWTRDYGNGQFIVFNGTILNAKKNRGVLTGIISLGKENLIYPVVNIKMVNIDDFPAPVPEGMDEKIFEEFSRDIPAFYREVWWSDMIKIAAKYGIKYTGFVIETYNNLTKPPFVKGDSKKLRNLLLYGRELLSIGGELGLHGYNHQSLAPDGYIKQDLGYEPWPDLNSMVISIQELVRFIHSIFGRYELRAYVPPSNILSPEGREAVIKANPDLRIIASVYLPNLEGDAYSQEFEVAEDRIIEFPRISAGYEKDDEKMWLIYNGINLYGVFAHFVHPDDILDSERNNGKSWTVLEKEFESILGEINYKYEWIRSYTISIAAQELIKYLECKPLIEYSGSMINIYTKNYRENIYCILRTDKEISEAENCEYKKISEDAYLLTLKNEKCSLIMD